ncbi:hypothetical protein C0992_005036 [Termitomyces sp. T32_za158]|nr:hypothetical protein C0992_005036 [Termitomyces sp. T32_za158]
MIKEAADARDEDVVSTSKAENTEVKSQKAKKKKNRKKKKKSTHSPPPPPPFLALLSESKTNRRLYADKPAENDQDSDEELSIAELKEKLAEATARHAYMKESTLKLKQSVSDLKAINAADKSWLYKSMENSLVVDYNMRRSMLHRARNVFLWAANLENSDLKPAALLAAVKAGMPRPFDVSDAALDMIFLNQSIASRRRYKRNVATLRRGDPLPPGDENKWFLGFDLSKEERATLIELFEYLNGFHPLHPFDDLYPDDAD